jgi:hypothetical protein
MSTPETTATEAPSPPPVPPMPPPPLDEGVSLLSQAFDLAGMLGHTLLAAQIGGGLSRLHQLLRRVTVLEQQMAALVAQQLARQSANVPPTSEPVAESPPAS